MTTLFLDASVLLAAFDPEDDRHEPASALLVDTETALATLDLARYVGATYVAAADEADRRLVGCDERDLVSKGLATLPANVRIAPPMPGL